MQGEPNCYRPLLGGGGGKLQIPTCQCAIPRTYTPHSANATDGQLHLLFPLSGHSIPHSLSSVGNNLQNYLMSIAEVSEQRRRGNPSTYFCKRHRKCKSRGAAKGLMAAASIPPQRGRLKPSLKTDEIEHLLTAHQDHLNTSSIPPSCGGFHKGRGFQLRNVPRDL